MTQQSSAYLGIGVEKLSPAVISQMPDLLKDGQGVLISEVVEDSPAAKAGLKKYDIVTRYDNQKVLSPEQFVKLVQHDQPDRVAKLTVIRRGNLKKMEVTLGQRPATGEQPAMDEFWQRPNFPMPLRRFAARPLTRQETENQWTSFDSMSLTRVDDNHYKAEITYKNDKSEIETRKYEGTLDEIRTAVKNCKDLPRNEQAHLMRAIGSFRSPYGFPFIEMMPDPEVMWDLE
ncbi:MAG: PDZ domain-containing protein [Pirellulales bacterium]|nr:PDZ domain-containing protein [Pirellulales bacterium]